VIGIRGALNGERPTVSAVDQPAILQEIQITPDCNIRSPELPRQIGDNCAPVSLHNLNNVSSPLFVQHDRICPTIASFCLAVFVVSIYHALKLLPP
jgi:hypothetical protein